MALAFTFASIEAPSAQYTHVTGINNSGEIVGTFQANATDPPHGFLFRNGTFVDLDKLSGRPSTLPNAINNRGEIVGTMPSTASLPDGFVYGHGKFQTLRAPNGQPTTPRAINDLDVIVGNRPSTQPDGSTLLGPSFAELAGHFIDIDHPDVVATVPSGINDRGSIVGTDTTDGTRYLGYLDAYGKFTDVTVPGAVNTLPSGINLLGEIAGTSNAIFAYPAGFVLNGATLTPVSYPGAVAFTEIAGVNDFGQVAGSYFLDDPQTRTVSEKGFIATPVRTIPP